MENTETVKIISDFLAAGHTVDILRGDTTFKIMPKQAASIAAKPNDIITLLSSQASRSSCEERSINDLTEKEEEEIWQSYRGNGGRYTFCQIEEVFHLKKRNGNNARTVCLRVDNRKGLLKSIRRRDLLPSRPFNLYNADQLLLFVYGAKTSLDEVQKRQLKDRIRSLGNNSEGSIRSKMSVYKKMSEFAASNNGDVSNFDYKGLSRADKQAWADFDKPESQHRLKLLLLLIEA